MNLKDKTLWQRNAAAIGGMVLFAAGINFFIVPASLYNGGVLGISQIIRTLLIQVFPSLASGTDIAGIINFILNIPLFIMAYISIGKSFFSRTLVCLISQTIFLSIFPIPATPLVNDSLTASIMGGLLAGTGIGISLRSGGSSGGMDIVGMFFTKKYKNFSVGKVSLTVNAVVYGICAILFGIPTAVYSIIYSAVSTLMTDKAHTQNINTEVVIYTKEEPEAILDYIVNEFHTEETTYMIVTILSKYECVHLRRGLKNIDEHAFVVVKEGMHIGGKYEKHL